MIYQVSQGDYYPLPRVDERFAAMSGQKQFTKLDLAKAYLQVELEEESKNMSHQGLFQFNR